MNSTQAIRKRLLEAGVSFAPNANIAEHLRPGDIEVIQAEVERHMQDVLDALVIDPNRDHNTQGTAKRIAKMYVREVFAGRFEAAPEVTDFQNDSALDEVYSLGPIAVRSACAHHLVPVTGRMWVGVLPGDKLIGISKFVRLANWMLTKFLRPSKGKPARRAHRPCSYGSKHARSGVRGATRSTRGSPIQSGGCR